MNFYELIIIGGGVSGTFCGLYKNKHIKTAILEQNNSILKKFQMTGKGKSNICNDSEPSEFIKNLIDHPKFIYPALNKYNGTDILKLLDSWKIKYYEKQPHRFHLDVSNEIYINKMQNALIENNVELFLNHTVIDIQKVEDKFEIKTNKGWFICKYLVLATGGKSFPKTGSNGSGYELAKLFNHHLSNLYPIGVGLYIDDVNIRNLQGLSLDDVHISVYNQQHKVIYEESGPLMFTHYGIGGPVVRRISGYVSYQLIQNKEVEIAINYTNKHKFIEELNKQHYLSECLNHINKKILNQLITNYQPNLDLKNLNKKQKEIIVNSLCNVIYRIKKVDSIDVAINTGGGICLNEINPNNYESRLIANLFLIGEMIDLNPRTNGYNITTCATTAFSCISYINEIIK